MKTGAVYDFTSAGKVLRTTHLRKGELLMSLDGKDIKMVQEVNLISARGNSAEVKKDKDGNYVIYEVKKRTVVG